MVYTKQEKQEIERVLAVFAKYLNQRDHCDIAWSNKLGYLLLDYHISKDNMIRLREVYPEIYAQFVEMSESRRFSIKIAAQPAA